MEMNTTLHKMFVHALKDMYYAEKKIHKSLPAVIKAAASSQLKDALTSHRDETAGHITNLEHIFSELGIAARGQKCDAIDGIIDEVKSVIDEFGKTNGCDAAIVFAGQAVEHYEITRYGTMRVWADAMGHTQISKLITANLEQEHAADEKMTAMAEQSINAQANVEEVDA